MGLYVHVSQCLNKKKKMTVFDFLNEGSENKTLGKLREETTPKQKVKDSALEEELDEMAAIDELETEDIGDVPPDTPKKPQRRVSKTLLDLLHKHEPKLKCNKSDANCLILYILNNVKKFDFGKDLDRLEKELTKLQKIVRHIHPSTSTQRNAFVEFTSIFKRYWNNNFRLR